MNDASKKLPKSFKFVADGATNSTVYTVKDSTAATIRVYWGDFNSHTDYYNSSFNEDFVKFGWHITENLDEPIKLERWMRVKTRRGQTYIVGDGVQQGNGLVLLRENGWDKAVFKYENDSSQDIIEVYAVPKYNRHLLNFSEMGDLIWSEETPELKAKKAQLEVLKNEKTAIEGQIETLEKEIG